MKCLLDVSLSMSSYGFAKNHKEDIFVRVILRQRAKCVNIPVVCRISEVQWRSKPGA